MPPSPSSTAWLAATRRRACSSRCGHMPAKYWASRASVSIPNVITHQGGRCKCYLLTNTKGQLADPHARLIVTDRVLGQLVENQVAEMCVGVQAAEVGLTEIHQDLIRSLVVAGVPAVIGFGDRVGERIVSVRAGQHLFHLEFQPRPARDHRLGPFLNRLTFL